MSPEFPSLSSPERPFDDDLVQTFQLEHSNLRGRLVRLGGALDEILTRHAYPEPVAHLLGETIALAAALAAMLKFEGIFTLQTKGDGPIRMMVADVTSTGDVRGYAQFDEAQLAAIDEDRVRDAPFATLIGQGYLAFTVDQGENTERYQGIVELSGNTLMDCVQHYFRQSEQVITGLTVAVRHGPEGWRGGALMLQRMPGEGGSAVTRPANDVEDDWRRAMVLMSTVTEAELTDARLPANDLLFRLFHEEGVRVWPPSPLQPGCRCSRERVAGVLGTLTDEELADMKIEGRIEASCQFCSTVYTFDDAQLAELRQR